MPFDLTGRVAYVTGAASGIGLATARALARAGAFVLLTDLDREAGEAAAAALVGEGLRAAFRVHDVTDRGQAREVVAHLMEAYGRLDVAVHNAGIQGPSVPAVAYPAEDWLRVLDVNLHGVWYGTQAALRPMLDAGRGAIVNVASVAGLVGFPLHAAYAASKHAVMGLTRTVALEVAARGVRVNAVCPGFTQTPMVERGLAQTGQHEGDLRQRIPQRRLVRPEEVAEAVLYLCSDEAASVVGSGLVLDGGILAG